jgi:DNA transformation protein
MRAADALEKATRNDDSLLAPHKTTLLNVLDASDQAEVRWQLVQCLPRLSLTQRELQAVAKRLQRCFSDETSRILRINCLQALIDLARRAPGLLDGAREALTTGLEDAAPSVRARARKLQQILAGAVGTEDTPMSLQNLKNLGPVSVKKLETAGIENANQLRELGAVAAYLRVKQATPGISLNMLYALQGALTDTHWSRLGEHERSALLLEVDAREQATAEDRSVSKLLNIGKALAGRLAQIGVRTRGDLARMGPVNAYRTMQAKSPVNLPVCYNLYALEGALRGCHWDALPDAVKDDLYREAKDEPRHRKSRGRR